MERMKLTKAMKTQLSLGGREFKLFCQNINHRTYGNVINGYLVSPLGQLEVRIHSNIKVDGKRVIDVRFFALMTATVPNVVCFDVKPYRDIYQIKTILSEQEVVDTLAGMCPTSMLCTVIPDSRPKKLLVHVPYSDLALLKVSFDSTSPVCDGAFMERLDQGIADVKLRFEILSAQRKILLV